MTRGTVVRLLVCGNAERGDDGAALAAVAGLLAGLPSEVRMMMDVRRCETLDLSDLLDLPELASCVIADAVTGLPPGHVVTIALSDLPGLDPDASPHPRSTHWMPIEQMVATVCLVRGRPLEGSFVGIGGRSFGFGRALGRPVRAALPAFRAAIEAALIHAAEAAGGQPAARTTIPSMQAKRPAE